MAPALTLIIPTGKPPPGAWWTAEGVREQAIAHNAEVLVACGNAIATPEPSAPCRVLHIPGADVFELRAAALVETRGEIIVVLEDHNLPAPDFCERILAAFKAHPEAAGVVGTASNGAPKLLDRASFLLTWAPFLSPMPELSLHRSPPPGVVAFRRSVVPMGFPPPGWLEYQMGPELLRTGRLVADDRIRIEHIQHVGLGAFAIQFHAGRGYGGMDHRPRATLSKSRRLRDAAKIPALLVRQTRDGLRRGNNRESFACMAAVGAVATCNALGQMVGVLFGPGNSPSHLE